MPKKKSKPAKTRDISLFFLRTRKAGPQTKRKKEAKKFTVNDELSKY